jgi:hypothetical protein
VKLKEMVIHNLQGHNKLLLIDKDSLPIDKDSLTIDKDSQ